MFIVVYFARAYLTYLQEKNSDSDSDSEDALGRGETQPGHKQVSKYRLGLVTFKLDLS